MLDGASRDDCIVRFTAPRGQALARLESKSQALTKNNNSFQAARDNGKCTAGLDSNSSLITDSLWSISMILYFNRVSVWCY